MCGGSSVNFPGPSQTEQDLMSEQLDLLRDQRNEIEGFKPFVLQQYGLRETKVMDPRRAELTTKIQDATSRNGGNPDAPEVMALRQQYTKLGFDNPATSMITGYEKTPEQLARDTRLQELQDQALALQKAQGERIKLALEGKLPLSTALLQQKEKDFAVLKESQERNGNELLGDSLDNAVAKTTSGQQALESLKKVYALATNAEQQAVIQGESGIPSTYAGLYGQSGINANPGVPGPSYAGMMPLYSAAMQPYQFQRQGQFSADSANAASKQSFQNTLLTGLLNGGARAAGAYAAK